MSAVFNPTRRNRNIGTAKQGHGQANRMVIPQVASVFRGWCEHLGKHRLVHKTLNEQDITFIVEENSGGCIHACTVDDILYVLNQLPVTDWRGITTFVFRQPTHKQRLIAPVWGRLFFTADFGSSFKTRGIIGPAISLEAVDPEKILRWSTSLDSDDLAELERLRSDGHSIEQIGKKHIITMTRKSVRQTQLFRTLVHEIGHWVDWLEKVEMPANKGGDFDTLVDEYWRRPKAEREAFANRYATAMRPRMSEGPLPKRAMPSS
jgi:hypothetical protein